VEEIGIEEQDGGRKQDWALTGSGGQAKGGRAMDFQSSENYIDRELARCRER
jgi:hypothetical protein